MVPSEITFVVVRLNLIELIVLQFCERSNLAISHGRTSIGNGDYAIIESYDTSISLYCDGRYLIYSEELGRVNRATMESLDIGIYHTTLAFEANNLYGVGLLLLHVTHNAHLTTAHILGRDGVGTITSNLRIGHVYLNPVGVALVVELILGCYIIAILEFEAILYEAGGRYNLHLEGLLIACRVTN